MRLVLLNADGTENKGFAARLHDKKPSYMDAAEKSKAVTIDGKPAKLVLHPKRETSNRVNFTGTKKDTWFYVDSDELHAMIAAKGGKALTFKTAEGRAANPAKEAPALQSEGAAA